MSARSDPGRTPEESNVPSLGRHRQLTNGSHSLGRTAAAGKINSALKAPTGRSPAWRPRVVRRHCPLATLRRQYHICRTYHGADSGVPDSTDRSASVAVSPSVVISPLTSTVTLALLVKFGQSYLPTPPALLGSAASFDGVAAGFVSAVGLLGDFSVTVADGSCRIGCLALYLASAFENPSR